MKDKSAELRKIHAIKYLKARIAEQQMGDSDLRLDNEAINYIAAKSNLSVSTLKKFFGIVHLEKPYAPRTGTLDQLAKLMGYESFAKFFLSLSLPQNTPSLPEADQERVILQDEENGFSEQKYRGTNSSVTGKGNDSDTFPNLPLTVHPIVIRSNHRYDAAWEGMLDDFVLSQPESVLLQLQRQLEGWNLWNPFFVRRFSLWMENFEKDEKPTALKVFHRLNYYSEIRFSHCLGMLAEKIRRELHQANIPIKNVLLVTSSKGGDSSNRHAYDLSKVLGLPKCSVYDVNHIQHFPLTLNHRLVFFNDTIGSGRQFVSEFGSFLQGIPDNQTIIAGIVCTTAGLKLIKSLVPGSRIFIGEIPEQTDSQFSSVEWKLIHQLGVKVYNTYPLGFGEHGLLLAYYFQCPNNSLPIIWADGINNKVQDRAYPWNPLFPYRRSNLESSFLSSESISLRSNTLATLNLIKELFDQGRYIDGAKKICQIKIWQVAHHLRSEISSIQQMLGDRHTMNDSTLRSVLLEFLQIITP